MDRRIAFKLVFLGLVSLTLQNLALQSPQPLACMVPQPGPVTSTASITSNGRSDVISTGAASITVGNDGQLILNQNQLGKGTTVSGGGSSAFNQFSRLGINTPNNPGNQIYPGSSNIAGSFNLNLINQNYAGVNSQPLGGYPGNNFIPQFFPGGTTGQVNPLGLQNKPQNWISNQQLLWQQQNLRKQQQEQARLQAQRKQEEALRKQRQEQARLQAQRQQQEALRRQRQEQGRLQAQRQQQEALKRQRQEEARLQAQRQKEQALRRQRQEQARLQAQRQQQEALRRQRQQQARLQAQRQQEQVLKKQRQQQARIKAQKQKQAQRLERERVSRLEAEDRARKCRNLNLRLEYAARSGVSLESNKGAVYWNDILVQSINPTNYNKNQVNIFVNGKEGNNVLKIVGSGRSDGLGLTIDNVKLIRQCDSRNFIVNGGFQNPSTGGSWSFYSSVEGWIGGSIQIGRGTIYNPYWSSQVCELDGNSNYQIRQNIQMNC